MVEEMVGIDFFIIFMGVINGGFDWLGKDLNVSNDFIFLCVIYEFGDMVDWEIIVGRDFLCDFVSDSIGFIFNEVVVEYMGVDDFIGMVMC